VQPCSAIYLSITPVIIYGEASNEKAMQDAIDIILFISNTPFKTTLELK
jgi:hypothetical protein